ncbi:MAG: methyltransferase, TrmH family [Pseudomonadota bacterium]|nr:methyltransferase, TrmH family [Pseudomonadota bacterium]
MQKRPPATKSHRAKPDRPRTERPRQEREEPSPQKKIPSRDRQEKDFDLRTQAREESRIYGINACLAFFEHRLELLVKVYLTERTAPKFGMVMKYCAAQRLVYRFVSDNELEKITGSGHHEGVCFVIKKSPLLAASKWLRLHGREPEQIVLALENVGNPHNLGAIMRSCAHFGVPAIAVNDAAAMLSGAAVRTAEGGAEYVQVIEYTRLDTMLSEFRKAGFQIAVTSSHGGVDVYRAELPAKLLILLGEESSGLSKRALAAGDLRLLIPGTGQVESLNVSAACSILLAEYWRQRVD